MNPPFNVRLSFKLFFFRELLIQLQDHFGGCGLCLLLSVDHFVVYIIEGIAYGK